MKRTLVLLLAIVGCAWLAPAAQNLQLQLVLKVPNAIAMDGLPEAGYYLLTIDDAVYHYANTASGLQFVRKFPVAAGQPIDIALAPLEQQDSLVITNSLATASQQTRSTLGQVLRYSPDGQLIKSWSVPHIPTGLAYDRGKRAVYFGTADSNELYRLDLPDGNPQYVCSVRGANQIGPIALDESGGVIYAADSQGTLFAVDLATKRTSRLSSSFALPAALRFDKAHRVLYVADQVDRKLYAVELTGKAGKRLISASRLLTSPSGLAPGRNDAILVADFKSGSVYETAGAPIAAKPAKLGKSAKARR